MNGFILITPITIWIAQIGLKRIIKKKRHEIWRVQRDLGWTWEELGKELMWGR